MLLCVCACTHGVNSEISQVRNFAWPRSHFFRLRLRFNIFESWSGNLFNLGIRLIFWLGLQSRQPKNTNGFTSEMTTQNLATTEIEKWLHFRVRFFKNFWPRVRKKNAESCRSRLRIRGYLCLQYNNNSAVSAKSAKIQFTSGYSWTCHYHLASSQYSLMREII